jgi:hypothetical protein
MATTSWLMRRGEGDEMWHIKAWPSDMIDSIQLCIPAELSPYCRSMTSLGSGFPFQAVSSVEIMNIHIDAESENEVEREEERETESRSGSRSGYIPDIPPRPVSV